MLTDEERVDVFFKTNSTAVVTVASLNLTANQNPENRFSPLFFASIFFGEHFNQKSTRFGPSFHCQVGSTSQTSTVSHGQDRFRELSVPCGFPSPRRSAVQKKEPPNEMTKKNPKFVVRNYRLLLPWKYMKPMVRIEHSEKKSKM